MRLNRFIKGIVSDIDYNYVTNEQWVFPTENMRIIQDGQSYRLCNVMGNEEVTLVQFSGDIKPLAFCTYKDIIFIISSAGGAIEIGTYPSFPTRVSTILQPTYSPLLNLERFGNPAPFRTTKTGFGPNNPITLFAREDYDNTINLYICDGNTSNKVINTGLTINGYIDRFTKEDDMPQNINQIVISKLHPVVKRHSIEAGGIMPVGNYFVYIRYVTDAYDSTHFITEYGPLQLSLGDTGRTIEGHEDREQSTGKKIVLELENLDPIFSKYEIGIVRWRGELFYPTYDIYIIDQYYDTKQTTVSIYGNEGKRTATLGDILISAIKDDASLTHTQLNNRYFGANWREMYYDKRKLSELALSCFVRPIYKPISDVKKIGYEYPDSIGHLGQHKNDEVTYDGRSFFRGEVYPFAVVFVINGRETEAFPILGHDYTSWSAQDSNDKGLVKMPDFKPGVIGANQKYNSLNNALGVEVIMTAMKAAINTDDELNSIIDGWYIVVGDRIKNRLTTGLSFFASHYCALGSITSGMFFGESNDITPTTYENCLYFPYYNSCPSKMFDPQTGAVRSYGVASLRNDGTRRALFTPEMLFDLNAAYQEVAFYKNHAQYEFPGVWNDVNILPIIYFAEYSSFYSVLNNTVGIATSMVHPKTYRAKGRFSSYFADPEVYSTHYAYRYDFLANGSVMNRSIKSPAYLGLIFDRDPGEYPDTYEYASVCMYADDQKYKEAALSYNVSAIGYTRITALLRQENTIQAYKGDCFLQRLFVRVNRWDHKHSDDEGHTDGNGKIYNHGIILSFMCEGTINHAMRNDVSWEAFENSGAYTYFPKCLETFSVIQWAATSDNADTAEEAFDVCPGYNVVKGTKQAMGYDVNAPSVNTQRTTRIRHSAVHVPYSYMDGYRLLWEREYVDYDLAKGAIKHINNVLGSLVSVQEHAINQHFTDDKQITVPTTEGEIVLGTQSSLAKQVRLLAEYGAQSPYSATSINSGLCGIDLYRGIIWIVSSKTSQYGSSYLQAVPLSEQLGISYETKLRTKQLNNGYDSVRIGYDKEYGEVLFSINNESIVYNEQHSIFTGIYTYASEFFANNEKTFLSYKNRLYWIHNAQDIPSFYGSMVVPKLSFVVNNAGAEQHAEEKIFESLVIEMSHSVLAAIQYQTNYQTAVHSPFIYPNAFWKAPKYQHNRWLVPIVANQIPGALFQTGSELRGNWLKATIVFPSQKIWINNVGTNLAESLQWIL